MVTETGVKKKKKKKKTPAAMTSERADKAERPSYSLRQRDGAGKEGAPVDPDTLLHRRVHNMPVPGYGKHNGTVTKIHPSARRVTITFDDDSKDTFDLSRVLKYLAEVGAQKPADQAVVDVQDLAVGSDTRAEEADRSAGGSEHELGDAQSADGEGAEASSLGFDEAQRAGVTGGNMADDDRMESGDGSSRVRPVCQRSPGAVVQRLARGVPVQEPSLLACLTTNARYYCANRAHWPRVCARNTYAEDRCRGLDG